jgi:serine/threonine protein kinase
MTCVAQIILKALAVLHEDGYVHTGEDKPSHPVIVETNYSPNIKPNNVLCNYKRDEDVNQDGSDIRFSKVLLADFGNCVPSSSNYAKQGELIGASIFRSPEASLKLPWGSPTDIWSFGAMVGLLLLKKEDSKLSITWPIL